MKSKHYYLYVEMGVSAEAAGPFASEAERDDAARARYYEGNPDEDAVFGMDIDSKGVPHVWDYSSEFMDAAQGEVIEG